MRPASAHYSKYKMAPDFVTASVEQHTIIKFLVKEKIKLTETFRKSNARYKEDPVTCKCL
jgi:hypothetical protein